MPGFTSPQNYPYPLYTEANDGPAQIQALATAIDGSIVTAQNTIARARNRPTAHVTGNVVQSIPNNVSTPMQFNVEDFDTDNMFNLGGSNTDAVVVTPGIYLITGEVRFVSNATGEREITIWRSGSAVARGGVKVKSVTGQPTTIQATGLVELFTPGLIFHLECLQTSGGALNSDLRRFSLTRVSF